MNVIVSVKGKTVRVNNLQFGPTYSSHEIAVNQGKLIHQKYHPQAQFEVIPEPSNKK